MIGRVLLVFVSLISLAACASLGVKTEGVSGPVAWQATDLDLSRQSIGNRDVWTYSFSLLLQEQGGERLVFNEIQMAIYQPGVGPGVATYNGVWPLAANGKMRVPLQSSITCPFGAGGSCLGPTVPVPLWQLVFRGKNDQGRPVSIKIDSTLPADPASVPAVSAKSVPAIELVKPPARQ